MSEDVVLECSRLNRYLICIEQPFDSFELFVLFDEGLFLGASLESRKQGDLLFEILDLFANVLWDLFMIGHGAESKFKDYIIY